MIAMFSILVLVCLNLNMLLSSIFKERIYIYAFCFTLYFGKFHDLFVAVTKNRFHNIDVF